MRVYGGRSDVMAFGYSDAVDKHPSAAASR
jgi:hypothetical protein